jgi:hypothetical protein
MVKKCHKNDFSILGKNSFFIKSNKNFNKKLQKIKENHFIKIFIRFYKIQKMFFIHTLRMPFFEVGFSVQKQIG